MSIEGRLRGAIDEHVGEPAADDRAWAGIQRRVEDGAGPEPKPPHERGQRFLAAAVALVVFGVVAVGLGLAIHHGGSSSMPPAAGPPAWLVDKARQEARFNGDPAPTSAEWVLTDAATIQQAFGYVNASEPDPAYVVILRGHFSSARGTPNSGVPTPRGSILSLVLDPVSHEVADWGLGNHDVSIPGLAPFPFSATPTPSQPAPMATVDVPSPGDVVAAFGSAWVQSGRDIWQLSEDGEVINRFNDLAQPPSLQYMGYGGAGQRTLAAGDGSLWSLDDGALLRINPVNGNVIASIRVPKGPGSVVFGEGAVWVACCSSGSFPTLFKIDPSADRIVDQTSTGVSIASLAVGDGSAWVLGIGEVPYVKRYDAASLRMIGSIIPVGARGMAAEGGGNLWVIDHGTGLDLVDPETQRVRSITIKGGPMMGLATYGSDVFVNAGSLLRVSGATGKVEVVGGAGRAQLANAGIAVSGDQSSGGVTVWLSEPADDTVVAIAVTQDS